MLDMGPLRSQSGSGSHRGPLQVQQPAQSRPHKADGTARNRPSQLDPEAKRRVANRLFRKYCLVAGGLVLGALVLVVAPLWIVHPPTGQRMLLSIPCTLLCALSWMAGAWWSWDKERWVFMAVTMGAMPIRLFAMLGWVMLVVSVCDVPLLVFVPFLMWHWLVFSVPEFAMLMELSQSERPVRSAGVQLGGGSASPSENGLARTCNHAGQARRA